VRDVGPVEVDGVAFAEEDDDLLVEVMLLQPGRGLEL